MKLKISRSQKETGMVSKTMVFCLDARVELTPEEADAVKRYKLGKQVIYNSEASKQHLEKGMGGLAQGGFMGSMRALTSLAMARLQLNVSVDSLTQGHHIECKDMDELIAAEEAIKQACVTLKSHLDTAKTFDGQEVVLEY